MDKESRDSNIFYSTTTNSEYYWKQNFTNYPLFESARYYCVDENHYVTQPNWNICEICNCIIRDREFDQK